MRGLPRGWRRFFLAAIGLAALALAAPAARAETFKVTSTPAGAAVEIDGVVVGTTPFHADYPGCYFHKPHTVFGARLEHAMVLRVSKDGYALQQITLTDGPLDWVGITGKKHGKYFVLRSDHFELQLEPVATAKDRAQREPGAWGRYTREGLLGSWMEAREAREKLQLAATWQPMAGPEPW
jgi:hypothetical protein